MDHARVVAFDATISNQKASHKAKDLVERLSIEEQVSLLTGNDFWRTKAIPEYGIPPIKTTDGPNGARGEYFANGTPAALFPCGVSLAATWNTTLVRRVGELLGTETRRRGADVLLAPTVCLHRHPLGGRNFESFSEDPYLTGKLAAAYIQGVQSTGIAATVKHFVGNEQETDRACVNSIIPERALRELYLKPFEIAIREARPMAIMTAYNAVNGIHCDQNSYLLGTILRGEWQYDGLVMSDWMGLTSSLPSLLAGCDLEMPRSDMWRGANLLRELERLQCNADAKSKSQLCKHACPRKVQNAIRSSATHVLNLIEQTRGLGHSGATPTECSGEDEELDKMIRNAGSEGIVLLKNERDLLPIRGCKKIAVIGPNANRAVAHGGGSASLNPLHTVTPLEGIASRTHVDVYFAQGCYPWKWVPLANEYCRTPDGRPGVLLEYFDNPDFRGQPIRRLQQTNTDLYLWDSPPESVRDKLHSFRVTTQITPKTTGMHTLGFSSVGPGRLRLAGEVYIDNWEWTQSGEAMFGNSAEVIREIYMTKGVPVEIVVESTNEIRPRSKIPPNGPNHHYGGARIGFFEDSRTNTLQEAAEVAEMADIAIVIVGLDAEWESEGYDRKDMDLPKSGSQDQLIEAVVKANPNTVVVSQSGGPVSMPWADKVPVIMQAWYQGQEAGHALADILFGVRNPSGKLPTTFPRRLEDTPAYVNWAPKNVQTRYEEGIFMGYRHYEHKKIEPLFPFGHGLSYSKFVYGLPSISNTVMAPRDAMIISVPITNTSNIEAAEVVQAYIRDVKSSVPRPEKELKAFAKVSLLPRQTKVVTLELDKHAVSFYDVERKTWVAEKGTFDVYLAASSVDIRQTVSFEILESFTWIF